MFQELLDANGQSTLASNKDITLPVVVHGFNGYSLQNITPYYWKIIDENNSIIAFVQPWQQMQNSISITDSKYTLVSMTTSRPQVQSGSAPQNTWQLVLELSTQSLPSQTQPITVSNSATVNLGNGTQVTLSGSSVVQVESMPALNLAPNQSVELQGTAQMEIIGNPTFQMAAGTEVGITAGQVVGVSGISQVVPTDLGNGLIRDLNGGVVYASNGGITSVTFAEQVTQIYIQNRGQAGSITVTGDEDPMMSSQGITLDSGDAMGIAWNTQKIYIKGTANQIPVQVQGWW